MDDKMKNKEAVVVEAKLQLSVAHQLQSTVTLEYANSDICEQTS